MQYKGENYCTCCSGAIMVDTNWLLVKDLFCANSTYYIVDRNICDKFAVSAMSLLQIYLLQVMYLTKFMVSIAKQINQIRNSKCCMLALYNL